MAKTLLVLMISTAMMYPVSAMEQDSISRHDSQNGSSPLLFDMNHYAETLMDQITFIPKENAAERLSLLQDLIKLKKPEKMKSAVNLMNALAPHCSKDAIKIIPKCCRIFKSRAIDRLISYECLFGQVFSPEMTSGEIEAILYEQLIPFYKKAMKSQESFLIDSFGKNPYIKINPYLHLSNDEKSGKIPPSDLKVKFIQIVDYFFTQYNENFEHLLDAIKLISGCPAGEAAGINDLYAQMHLGLSNGGLAADYEQSALGICREVIENMINSGTNDFYKELCLLSKEEIKDEYSSHGITHVRNLLGLNTPPQMDWHTKGLYLGLLWSTKKKVLDVLFGSHLTPQYFIKQFKLIVSAESHLKKLNEIRMGFENVGLLKANEFWEITENEEGDIVSSRISDVAILKILDHVGILKIFGKNELNTRSLPNIFESN